MTPSLLRTALAGLLMLFSPLLLAHPGHGAGFDGGLGAGLLHPLTGFDHLAAMLGVGLWAAQQRGAARWLMPASFLVLMAVGALLGASAIAPTGIEQGIAASVLLIGLLVSSALPLPVLLGVPLAGGFALFHGFAHGAEMPAATDGLLFGIGFLASAALLQAVGYLCARRLARHSPLLRSAGAMLAAYGAALLLHAL